MKLVIQTNTLEALWAVYKSFYVGRNKQAKVENDSILPSLHESGVVGRVCTKWGLPLTDFKVSTSEEPDEFKVIVNYSGDDKMAFSNVCFSLVNAYEFGENNLNSIKGAQFEF